MPCESRILQSSPKGQVKLVLWETVQRSHIENLREVSKKYYVLISLSTRTHNNKYAHLLKRVRRIHLSQKGAVQNSFCTAPALYLGV